MRSSHVTGSKVKGEGKASPRRGHEVPEGE